MKVFKYEVYVFDFEGYGEDEYKTIIEQHRHLPAAQVFPKGEIDIGEWDDDHELNGGNQKTFDKHFEGR